jgi:tRNA/tmRNA/rRNA uracil-C5-methylase (TrmA/RlmC/RlmD family)
MTHKFETLIAVHIRYDMPNADLHYAELLSVKMRETIINHIQSQPIDELRTTADELNMEVNLSPYRARVTYAGAQDSITSEASENRRSPNVFIYGRLASMGGMIAEMSSNRFRRIRKTSPLGQRAQHLDTAQHNSIISTNDEWVTLPTLPMSTARMILRRAWNTMRSNEDDRMVDLVQEATVDILDGIFEDGLPISREMTEAERRNLNGGYDVF